MGVTQKIHDAGQSKRTAGWRPSTGPGSDTRYKPETYSSSSCSGGECCCVFQLSVSMAVRIRAYLSVTRLFAVMRLLLLLLCGVVLQNHTPYAEKPRYERCVELLYMIIEKKNRCRDRDSHHSLWAGQATWYHSPGMPKEIDGALIYGKRGVKLSPRNAPDGRPDAVLACEAIARLLQCELCSAHKTQKAKSTTFR